MVADPARRACEPAGPDRGGRVAGRSSRFRGTQGTSVIGVFGATVATTGASEKLLVRLGKKDFEKVYLFPNSHAGYYPGAKTIDGSASGFTGGAGFNGIVVALFGQLHPLWSIPASVLFGGLLVGANSMQRAVQVPSAFVTVLNGLVVIFVVIAVKSGGEQDIGAGWPRSMRMNRPRLPPTRKKYKRR